VRVALRGIEIIMLDVPDTQWLEDIGTTKIAG
jgi:hypothetical protein